jgi:hypothetical protein
LSGAVRSPASGKTFCRVIGLKGLAEKGSEESAEEQEADRGTKRSKWKKQRINQTLGEAL